MPQNNAALIRHLAEKVMGWHVECGGWCGVTGWQRGFDEFNPTTSWSDAGIVWERAREIGIEISLFGQYRGRWTAQHPKGGTSADSGPRALALAVAKATGWEGEDGE